MNWPDWVHGKLVTSAPLIAAIPTDRIKGAGSIEGKLPCPFAAIRFGTEFPRVGDAVEQEVTIWIHDDPGSYDLINDCLILVRNALDSASIPVLGAFACTWQGNSADLSDDGFKTLVRYASFQLIGR